MIHPTCEKLSIDFERLPKDFRVCAKCGSPMKNENPRSIVPTQHADSFYFQPRWYCKLCDTRSIMGNRKVYKPLCILY